MSQYRNHKNKSKLPTLLENTDTQSSAQIEDVGSAGNTQSGLIAPLMQNPTTPKSPIETPERGLAVAFLKNQHAAKTQNLKHPAAINQAPATRPPTTKPPTHSQNSKSSETLPPQPRKPKPENREREAEPRGRELQERDLDVAKRMHEIAQRERSVGRREQEMDSRVMELECREHALKSREGVLKERKKQLDEIKQHLHAQFQHQHQPHDRDPPIKSTGSCETKLTTQHPPSATVLRSRERPHPCHTVRKIGRSETGTQRERTPRWWV